MMAVRSIALIFWAISSSQAFAIGLDASILSSLGSSPAIRGQRITADIASGDRWRRFVFHEPQLSYSSIDSGNQDSWGLALATPFPGKVFAYTELDRIKSQGERVEIFAKKQDVAKQVSDAYLDCASGRALLEIQRIALRDLLTLERSFSAMYESGHASQAERIGAELQARQTRVEVSEAASKAETSCRKWRALMGSHDETLLPDGMPDDLQAETLRELGDKGAAELRAESTLHLVDANDHLRWWMQAPDLNWTYSRNHYLTATGSPTGREWTTSYGVAMTIPIFFLVDEKVEADRARAQAMMDRRAAEVDQFTADSERAQAARDFQRGKRRISELRKKDLALAEALVQSTLAAYKIGKLGFAEIMMSRKTLNDLRAQEVQLQAAVIQARLKCLAKCESTEPLQGEEL